MKLGSAAEVREACELILVALLPAEARFEKLRHSHAGQSCVYANKRGRRRLGLPRLGALTILCFRKGPGAWPATPLARGWVGAYLG
jgi:hypothetical protein